MIDIVREIGTVQREVGSGRLAAGEDVRVLLRRTYEAPIDDVWDALTNPERIGRWFLPIDGDYRLGGRYQFEGNAGGEIVACERPHRLRVTWVLGEPATETDTSEVEVRLSPAGDEATVFELEHTAIVPDEMWGEYGPAPSAWAGKGLLGLALHLRGQTVGDSTAWQVSDEDGRSTPGAARRGARRTAPRGLTRTWWRATSRTPLRSTPRPPTLGRDAERCAGIRPAQSRGDSRASRRSTQDRQRIRWRCGSRADESRSISAHADVSFATDTQAQHDETHDHGALDQRGDDDLTYLSEQADLHRRPQRRGAHGRSAFRSCPRRAL